MPSPRAQKLGLPTYHAQLGKDYDHRTFKMRLSKKLIPVQGTIECLVVMENPRDAIKYRTPKGVLVPLRQRMPIIMDRERIGEATIGRIEYYRDGIHYFSRFVLNELTGQPQARRTGG